jgi:hypothetical protein
MFSYKKISKYGRMISKDYWIYILFSFVISIIISIVVQSVMAIFMGIYAINGISNTVTPQNTPPSPDNLMPYLNQSFGAMFGITAVTASIQYILSLLLMPNLNGQVIKNVLKRTLKRNNYIN